MSTRKENAKVNVYSEKQRQKLISRLKELKQKIGTRKIENEKLEKKIVQKKQLFGRIEHIYQDKAKDLKNELE